MTEQEKRDMVRRSYRYRCGLKAAQDEQTRVQQRVRTLEHALSEALHQLARLLGS